MLLLISSISIDPSQYPSNKPSTLSYLVPSVEHYGNPSSIPKYVPSRITSRTPSVVSITLSNSSLTTDPCQSPNSKPSDLPSIFPSEEHFDDPSSEPLNVTSDGLSIAHFFQALPYTFSLFYYFHLCQDQIYLLIPQKSNLQ